MLIKLISHDGIESYVTITVTSPEGVVEVTAACYPQLAVLGERCQVGGVDVLRETALMGKVLAEGSEGRCTEGEVQAFVQAVAVGRRNTIGQVVDGIVVVALI